MITNPRRPLARCFFLLLTALALQACTMTDTTTSDLAPNQLRFADHTWTIKSSTQPVGPGPNRFSSRPDDIFVDDHGHLHLSLTQRDNQWLATELISDFPAGYGRYTITIGPGADTLDPNVVLGIFTWDDQTWQSDANSEIDIEWARWAEAEAPNLHYSVHPTRGPDGQLHPERYHGNHTDLHNQGATHIITWRPDRITCVTYLGGQPTHPDRLLSAWSYHPDLHPDRQTADADNRTDPIRLPQPSPTTTFRFNLWLLDANRDGLADPPTNHQPVTITITDFTYEPLNEASPEAGS